MEAEEKIETVLPDGNIPAETARRNGPTWRALAVSIIVAIVLSVAATLLLGGSFRFTGAAGAGGCGQGGDCCPPPEAGK